MTATYTPSAAKRMALNAARREHQLQLAVEGKVRRAPVPVDMEESYQGWLDDPEAASLRRQIALSNARLDQLIQRLEDFEDDEDRDKVWVKICDMMNRIRGFSDSELRRTLAIRASIPVEDFRTLWSDALAVIEANVADESTRRAIDAGFARIGQLALKGRPGEGDPWPEGPPLPGDDGNS